MFDKTRLRMYLMFVAPLLESVSRMLANKDANTDGPDDKAASFLHFAAVGVTAIIEDRPLPMVPSILIGDINAIDEIDRPADVDIVDGKFISKPRGFVDPRTTEQQPEPSEDPNTYVK